VSLEAVGFWGLAIVLIVSSLLTVLSKNLFHSVLYLALALVTTAGVFLSLNAEFLFAVQIFLYAGGVVTLVVFAIMLTERLVGERVSQMSRGVGVGSLVSVTLDVFSQEWPCGCGCGATIKLTYRPAHPPPFFRSGHNSRMPEPFRKIARITSRK